jgi:rRNA pseudouridine-1189 N-methylase Emg1 (Nep1/Mra1 family)
MNKNYNIIIADAAVSLVPEEWLSNEKISRYNKQYKRLPIVDASDHQHLLEKIPREERLDRPDILHFGLLTLLNYQQLLKDTSINFEIFFTCKYGKFKVARDTRLPRSQKRFYGILENLFQGKVNPYIMSGSLNFEKPTIAFSSDADRILTRDISAADNIDNLGNLKNIENIVFGGFAVGDYRSNLGNAQLYSLHKNPMELWTALSMFVSRFLM